MTLGAQRTWTDLAQAVRIPHGAGRDTRVDEAANFEPAGGRAGRDGVDSVLNEGAHVEIHCNQLQLPCLDLLRSGLGVRLRM